MTHLLQLDSSAGGAASTSRAVTRTFADAWLAAGGTGTNTVTVRDVHADPPPHLPDAALHWAPRLRVAGETPDPAAVAVQDAYLTELLAADVVLVGAPMYNWSLPSTLKAWIDHIHVLGVTAPFDTKDQPLRGRSAVIVSSRGASYGPDTPTAGWDHTVPPLELLFGQALGMQVEVIEIELTLADRIPPMAPMRDRAAASLAAAHARASELAGALSHR